MINPLRKMHMEHSWLSKNELIDECAELRIRVAELEEVIADTHRLYLHLAEDSNELFENDPTDDPRNYHRALDYRSCATLLKHRLATIAREDVLLTNHHTT